MPDGDWYYVENGQAVGPVSKSVLQQRLLTGLLRSTDLVWQAGMPEWVAAGRVPELFLTAPPGFGDRGAAVPPMAPYPPMGPGGAHAAAPPVTYAGFWKRFAAAIIDGIVLVVVGGVAGGILGAAGGDRETINLTGNVTGIVLNMLYFALMESSTLQATLGKMALGIQVTDLHGNPISFGRAVGRHFAKILSAVILLIGYVMAGFTEKKQALHDMIAGCLVVNKAR